MTTDTQNHQAIRGLLENAVQQVLSTQKQVAAIESRLQEIKSQIDLSLEAIDPVLQQWETGDRDVEKVRNDAAATFDEIFDHVSRIVNDAREQMLNPRSDGAGSQDVSPNATEAAAEVIAEAMGETVPDEPTPVEPTPVEPTPVESTPVETLSAETLTGSQVGQRATESLNEMIATIDETHTETKAETDMSQEQEPVSETEPETEPETETETPEVVSRERETTEVEVQSVAKEVPKGPGSMDSLSELLAKAKAASSETGSPAADFPSLDDEEEDAQTVSELLKTTTGSFATQ